MPLNLFLPDYSQLAVGGYPTEMISQLSTWDMAPLMSASGVEKAKSAFSKTPFTFNIKIKPGKTAMLRAHNVQHEFDHASPHAINIIYGCNITTINNAIPFTPWILAHRFHHCFLLDIVSGTIPTIDHDIRNIMAAIMGQSWAVEYLITLMTTRSARELNLNTNGEDAISELIAQYIITGGIKLTRYDEYLSRVDKYAGNRVELSWRKLPELIFDDKMSEIEWRIDNAIHEWITSLVGGRYCF